MKSVLFLIIFSVLYSQPIGGYQGSFATEVVDAKNIAYGNIGILNNNNSFGPIYNPGLISKKRFLIGLSYNYLSLNRYKNAAIIGFKVPPNARASIGYIGSGVKNIIGRGYSGQLIDSFDWINHHLFFTFGIKLFKNISTGIKLNIFFQHLIEEVSSTGLGFDIGFLVKPIHKLDIGLTIRNIKAKSNWKIIMDDGTLRDYNEYYPLIYSLGGNLKLIPNLSLLNQIDIYSITSIGYIGYENKIGVEYKYESLDKPIFLRFGINNKSYAIGFSASINKYTELNYGLVLSRINIGNSHVFTWDIIL
ncbi:MAG: hypothetical protein CMF96_01020 [Candidatus Marinimicrobia bacterium]|nr:hypothetical protein [Candidatus Neomarinimicrobiota bacterium]|tara:strand:- start:493 stop:1407 length:915 start_codon:yes stop_codon:yes gene_type:complete